MASQMKKFIDAVNAGEDWDTFHQLKDGWNWLTGQTAEDERTERVNDANLQATKDTNATNLQIARENLGYQRELQEYNAALQERLFEREDTSYQRTKEDMLKAGLNPLTMQGTNGAGEAIAQSPLNNSFQAQAPQFQKAQTMSSPLMALQNFSSVLGTAITSLESIRNGKANRDALRKQANLNDFNSFIANLDKGMWWNEETGKPDIDEDIFDKYLEQKAKEKDYNIAKMKHDMREWQHFEDSGKYESDTNFEKTITAVTDWLTGDRSSSAWNKLTGKYPFLKMFTNWAKDLFSDKPYDTVATDSRGNKSYYKDGKEVDEKGNPIKQKNKF